MTQCPNCKFDFADEDFIFSKNICRYCDPDYDPYKEKIEDQEIIKALESEDFEQQYLDIGYTKINAEEVFYYGFRINGKEAIILSNGRILRNTEEKFRDKTIGTNEIKEAINNYNGHLGDIAYRISKQTVKKYYTKSSRNHIVNPKEVYVSIRNKILEYMDFSGQDEIADVLTCWIIATYCYPVFHWFPHILINAPSGSGKSKCLTIIMYLSFGGFDLGASAGVTPAQIFRTIESNRGTIIIDEFEQVDSDTQRLVNQILNASASKDSYIIRTEQIDKKWTSYKFPIYCPKAVGNISGINPTSLSRFIAFKWLKTNTSKGKLKPEKEKSKISFEPLRESLYLFNLENWKEIRDTYENLDLDKLNNRDSDNWIPLFSIAKFIDKNTNNELKVEDQLNKYVEDYKELDIETNDNTSEFFYLLYENLSENEQYYTPKEVSQLNGISDLLNYLKSPAHWIGSKLKLFKFRQYKIKGNRKYLLSKNSVKNIIDTYYTNIMSPNVIMSPNDSNDPQRNLRVTLGDMGGVMPEGQRVDISIEKIGDPNEQ